MQQSRGLLNLTIRSGIYRYDETVSINSTIKEAFTSVGIKTDELSTVTLNGQPLMPCDLDKSFKDLEYEDGDQVFLSKLVKFGLSADGKYMVAN